MAFYRCIGGNGGGGVTPTDITPSDSSPVALSANGVYKALAAGYAIESEPESVTPSAEGTAFSAGMNNMSSAGYAYSEQPSAGPYSETYSDLTANSSKTVTGLTVGKHYLVLAYIIIATNVSYTRYDGCTTGDGTLTKISNITSGNVHGAGTFYDLVPSSSSVTITLPQNGYMKVLEN